MTTPIESIAQAAALVQAGKYEEARVWLARYLRENPNSEEGWYFLSLAVSEREKHIYCLQQVLRINPANETARARLEKLTRTAAPPPARTPVPAAPAETARPAASTFQAQKFQPTPAPPPPAPPPPAPPPPAAIPPPARPTSFESEAAVPGRRKPAKTGVPSSLLVLLIIAGIVVIAGGIYYGWQTYIAQPPLPTPLVIAVASTPRRTLPPTWTPTVTPSPTFTRTISPTPTISPMPTMPEAGPTASARMDELEEQAIALRGLQKLAEVPRYVSNRSQYQQKVNAALLEPEKLAKIQQEEIALKALGLISPTYDLPEFVANHTMTGVSGIYSSIEKAIYVFGLRFTGVEAFVYVHEFGHALVDQHYPFDTQLGLYPDCRWDQQRCEAIVAVLEGDATLLMYRWWQEYATNEEYRDFWYYVPPSVLPSGQEPPPFASVDYLLAYDYGFDFASYLFNRGGLAALNRVYGNLPYSTEQILHPEKYVAGERPVAVNDPDLGSLLGSGWLVMPKDVLGEWDTYLLLGYGHDNAAQLDDETARAAAAGWGGDQFQAAQHTGDAGLALLAHWTWDSQNEGAQFSAALQTYQDLRFSPEAVELGAGRCRAANRQISCVLSAGRETVWLIAPDAETMSSLLAAFSDFR